MASRAGSSIGTFLMSLPVSAILLMAVFGVPRFDPGEAGESGWQSARQFLASLIQGDAGKTPTDDPFGPPGDPFHDDASLFDEEAVPWGASEADDPATDVAPPRRTPRNKPPDGSSAGPSKPKAKPKPKPQGGALNHSPGGTGATPAKITWTAARRRLADMGIDQFHLEAGLDPDQFLFVCQFSPGNDPMVTQRFEAEATDPLTAVENVLAQIDDWLAQRHADDASSWLTPGRN